MVVIIINTMIYMYRQFIGPVFGGGITELTNFRTCTAVRMIAVVITIIIIPNSSLDVYPKIS